MELYKRHSELKSLTRIFASGFTFLFVILPIFLSATHIVGGALNYTYLGGNNYTIRLKLYKDCGAGTAAFPANVTILVRGTNGASFSPSKDITMNLVSVTSVPGNTLPCAVNPNPMPCVQEGTYSITVNNLNPSSGGYHLYYQVSARNLSLSNVNNACNCVGESFYAFIPGSGLNSACTCSAYANSNPAYNALPPLFLCLNQPFNFNHSATDLDGDSLAYSMYTPYNGDNGTGPLDPNFPSNTASFTPVTFLSGYTANNPLGITSPFNINPLTGVITATPNQLGQFVVGIKVREYRNGVLLSETTRDFQFNVLNCPTPPPSLAVADFSMNTSCTKTIQAGGISGASATWNSIAPGTLGQYNSYLSCTLACLSITVVAPVSPPSFVDYKVCGTSTNCAGTTLCDTFRVHFTPLLSASIIPVLPTMCAGQTSSTLSAIASGGAPPYSFLWNNVNPSQTINVGAGTYNLKLTDATGCTPLYQSVVVTSYSSPVSINAGTNQTVCIQNPICPLNATLSGATGGVWSGGTGAFSPNNTQLTNAFYIPSQTDLTAGSVKLFLTSTGNGQCPAVVDSLTIYFSSFTGSIITTTLSASCYGNSNASASVTVNNGNAPFQFLWTTAPSQTTSFANNLSIGTYSVLITDGIGCTSQATVQLTQPLPISISSSVQAVACFGQNTGMIRTNVSGGTAPYTYSWSPTAATASSITNLTSGSYSLIVADSKSCTSTAIFTVTQNAALALSLQTNSITCFGLSNGAASCTVSGGSTPYSYSWTPLASNAASVSGLSAGTYTLLARDAANCQIQTTIAIVSPSAINLTVSYTNVTCASYSNASISTSVTGGIGTITYSWSPTPSTNSTLNNLAGNTYTLRLVDANACQLFTTVTITEPPTLSLSLQTIKNVSCFSASNASATALASGGTSPYSYTWSPIGGNSAQAVNLSQGTYTVVVNDLNLCSQSLSFSISQPTALSAVASSSAVSCKNGTNGAVQVSANGGTSPFNYTWLPGGATTSSVSNITAGTYSVQISDAQACTLTKTVVVTEPTAIIIVISSTAVSCFGGSNGKAQATISGGSAAYSYTWLPSLQTTTIANSLTSGNYTFFVSDTNNCTASATTTISQATLLNAIISTTNETCNYLNNGKASALASGGNGTYTYLWSPGALTTSLITNLSAGLFSLTVTDSKSCNITQTISISEPNPISISFTNQINVSCFGGSNAQVTALTNGGTPAYSYSWSPSANLVATAIGLSVGTHSVLVTDINNCQTTASVQITEPAPLSILSSITNINCNGGSNGAVALSTSGGTAPYLHTLMPGNISGANFSNLSPGNYTVYTSDANNCSTSGTVSISQPISITAVTNATNSACLSNNGAASVSVTAGGSPPFTYTWLPSGGNGSSTSGLSPGSYTILIGDNSSCISTRIVNISDLSGPQVAIDSYSNILCHAGTNGALTATFTGGTGPNYTYSWSPVGGAALIANNLSTGYYSIKVTDNLGCIGVATSTLLSEPFTITATIFSSSVSCKGGSDGAASAAITGGTAPYTYTWLPINSTSANANNLSAGNFSFQVVDANNCNATFPFSITEPASNVSLSLTAFPSSCFGTSNGSISASAFGGTSPYSFNLLSSALTGPILSGLIAGTYTVQVSDRNLCTQSSTITIAQPSALTASFTVKNSDCSLANGSATISAQGGTGPYNFQWFPINSTNPTNSNLLSGSYTVAVSDSHACSTTTRVILTDNPAPSVTINMTQSVSCPSGTNGALSASIVGGSGPFSYAWFPGGQITSSISNLPAGNNTLILVSSNACTISLAAPTIPQPSPLWTSVSSRSIDCNAVPSGSASIVSGGGTLPHAYSWLPSAAATNTIGTLSAGNYTVRLTDNNNCVLNTSFSITQPSTSLSIALATTSISCFSGSNGAVTSTVMGGTPPYSYSWSPTPSLGSSLSNLTTGTYSLQFSDRNGCMSSTNAAVFQPAAALALATTISSITCFNSANGSVSVSTNGGTAPYAFVWTGSSSTSSIALGLAIGNFQIQVTDVNGCRANTSALITQPTALVGTLQSLAPACAQNNGSLSAIVSGGQGAYTYTWTPSTVNTYSVGNLSAGNYSVLVRDQNNCVLTLSASLVNVPGPIANWASIKNSSCFGTSTGSLAVNITSGTAPYQINWLPFGGTTSSATNLSAGAYSVAVTDARNCSTQLSFTLTQPNELQFNTAATKSISCYGTATGGATVLAIGGTPAYSYTWYPIGNGTQLNNTTAGAYTVAVKDAQNCKKTISFSLTQPAPLSTSISLLEHPLCYGGTGQAAALVAGGNAPYTYTWNSQPPQFAANLQLVKAGTYWLSIRDANQCATSISATLNQTNKVQTLAVPIDTICKGSSALLVAQANGGTGQYHYTWAPDGAVNNGTFSPSPTSSTHYTVVAFDENGCGGNESIAQVNVLDFTKSNIKLYGETPICPGSKSLFGALANGNIGTLNFHWSDQLAPNAGPFLVAPSGTKTYYLQVDNQCNQVVKDSITIEISQIPLADLFADTLGACVPAPVQFFDRSLTRDVNDPIITWEWDFGDGVIAGEQNPLHKYMTPGTFTTYLQVTTDRGCKASKTGTFSIVVYPLPKASFSLNASNFQLPYESLIFTNQSKGAKKYEWLFSDGGSSVLENPNYRPNSIGNLSITLIATSDNTCRDTAYTVVSTFADLIFPTAFTPNKDQSNNGVYDVTSLSNDVFFPYTSGVTEYYIQIFDRWGELIFESTDINIGWDGYYKGKLCQEGVYYYTAKVKLSDGREFQHKADITLIK
jgi:gliding motility-associated-like protein